MKISDAVARVRSVLDLVCSSPTHELEAAELRTRISDLAGARAAIEAMELEAYSNGMSIARTDTGLPTVYGAKVISVSGLPAEDENVVMVLGSGCFKAVFESSDSTNSHDDEFSRNVQRIASIRYVAPVALSSLSAQYFTAVIA